jgi:hypothetical protein
MPRGGGGGGGYSRGRGRRDDRDDRNDRNDRYDDRERDRYVLSAPVKYSIDERQRTIWS